MTATALKTFNAIGKTEQDRYLFAASTVLRMTIPGFASLDNAQVADAIGTVAAGLHLADHAVIDGINKRADKAATTSARKYDVVDPETSRAKAKLLSETLKATKPEAKMVTVAVTKKKTAPKVPDTYVLVTDAWHIVGKEYKQEKRAANAAATYNADQKKRYRKHALKATVMTLADHTKGDYLVETTNMLNPKAKAKIRRSQVGTACDPATESYHSA